jgi:hypothetical protein
MRSHTPRLLSLLGIVSLTTLAACDRMGAARTARVDSVALLSQQLAEAEQGVKQRDAVMSELAQTARMVNEIDSSLSAVKGLKIRAPKRTSADDPWSARHDSLLAKVEGVTKLLSQSRARVAQLTKDNKALGGRVSDYQNTIRDLEATVERQKGEIVALGATIDSLRTVGTVLAAERDATRDTLRGERDVSSTVYFVVGRKGELLKRHIVSEEGSKRFMLVGGRSLVPARRLDASEFEVADQRRDLVIKLPDPAKKYRVVSRHDAGLLVAGRKPDGSLDGTLRVTDPSRFWATSRYLIIVQN